MASILNERALVNALVMLLATGGSTNLTLHLVAIGQCAGLQLDWDDMARLSEVVPTLARIYPNGKADVNHFQAAGGTAFLFRQLLDAGLLHRDVNTIVGSGLDHYTREPVLQDGRLHYRDGPDASLDVTILRGCSEPFRHDGGMKVVEGNLGRGVIKVSAVDEAHWQVTAPCRVFDDQAAFLRAFENNEFQQDVIVVVRFQGPGANGMPELHKLTPYLGILQDRGLQVALVTDGRMSGASGKVPAVIHLSPEADHGGPLARLQDGDRLWLDARVGKLNIQIDDAEWAARPVAKHSQPVRRGWGRELFGFARGQVSSAEQGASCFTESLRYSDGDRA